jgi:hypothetical protein
MSDLKKYCVVFICNKKYFEKFVYTCQQLITNGKYNGDICLTIGDDLFQDNILECEFIKKNNIIIKYFSNMQFSNEFLEINNKVKHDGRNLTKKFQWHKLHLFNTFFKNWDYILYMDCGMNIYSDISPILNECRTNTLLAHSDAYPTYHDKLECQFDKTIVDYFIKLDNEYDLNIDYFQTALMLYDSKIIKENTYRNLLQLAFEYPISKTNEQGIISLYFTNIKPLYKQIKTHNETTHFYDYCFRNNYDKYIITKLNWCL